MNENTYLRIPLNDFKKIHKDYVIELWHISRVPYYKRSERMSYCVKQFLEKYSEFKNHGKSVLLFIENTIE